MATLDYLNLKSLVVCILNLSIIKWRYLSLANNYFVKSLSQGIFKVSLFPSFIYQQKEYFSLISCFLVFALQLWLMRSEMFKEIGVGDGVTFCVPEIFFKMCVVYGLYICGFRRLAAAAGYNALYTEINVKSQ